MGLDRPEVVNKIYLLTYYLLTYLLTYCDIQSRCMYELPE